MNIVTDLFEWQQIRKKFQSQSIGFVPTMGNLHAGHMSLCERARAENAIVVVSIFVNPTQFNQASDFEHYPRTLEQDKILLQQQKIDYLFLPEADAIYHDQYQLQVTESELSVLLEGEHRPGHFTGMLTIVLKLLNLVQPTHAYLGEKDYQQLLLIKKMVDAFFLPINIIGCPIIRDRDGLALSSRNARLSAEQRIQASHFPRLLHATLPLEEIKKQLENLHFKVDYIAEQWSRRLGAVWVGDVRLIDNILI